jgi:hypothetical protein
MVYEAVVADLDEFGVLEEGRRRNLHVSSAMPEPCLPDEVPSADKRDEICPASDEMDAGTPVSNHCGHPLSAQR